jgi:hypothetical protein
MVVTFAGGEVGFVWRGCDEFPVRLRAACHKDEVDLGIVEDDFDRRRQVGFAVAIAFVLLLLEHDDRSKRFGQLLFGRNDLLSVRSRHGKSLASVANCAHEERNGEQEPHAESAVTWKFVQGQTGARQS